jgi:sugar O-acyltransferase (sialic acid O-acetyltransferase NeuD family)
MSSGVTNFIFFDANAQKNEAFLGYPVVSEWPACLSSGWAAFSASGDNRRREIQILEIERRQWPLATIISGSATLGVGCQVGAGSFVGHHAHVGPKARIGAGCIINTAAIVEHECSIGDYTHVSVNSVVAGRSSIGSMGFIGAGATLIDGIQVTDNVTIGAGGVVVDSISDAGVYLGLPAKKLVDQ